MQEVSLQGAVAIAPRKDTLNVFISVADFVAYAGQKGDDNLVGMHNM